MSSFTKTFLPGTLVIRTGSHRYFDRVEKARRKNRVRCDLGHGRECFGNKSQNGKEAWVERVSLALDEVFSRLEAIQDSAVAGRTLARRVFDYLRIGKMNTDPVCVYSFVPRGMLQ